MAVEVTAEEIDQAREAAGETSYSFVEARVAALNDTQRDRLKDLALAWSRVRSKFVRVKSKVEVDYGHNRAEIRAQVRSLLSLPGETAYGGSSSAAGAGTVSVCNEFNY
jgi:hypothetical protein